jgi:uncharacterized protein (DUF2147 family)
MLYIPTVLAQPLTGDWITIDDKTGQKRARVHISIVDGQLEGTILQVYSQAGDTGICSKCPGKFKDQPVQGLEFLWGLKEKEHGVWDGGQILDPKTGKIYRAKLKIQNNKLFVRGYVGISVLGRTQVWVR